MEKVYSGQYFEAMNVKNLLENLNIHVFVENDNMSLIEPFAVSPGGTSPVVLKVNKQNYNQAIETIKAYENGELALGKEIDKSVIIAMLKKEGFVVRRSSQEPLSPGSNNGVCGLSQGPYRESAVAKPIHFVSIFPLEFPI